MVVLGTGEGRRERHFRPRYLNASSFRRRERVVDGRGLRGSRKEERGRGRGRDGEGERGGGGGQGRAVAGSLALLSRLFFIAMLSRVLVEGGCAKKESDCLRERKRRKLKKRGR